MDDTLRQQLEDLKKLNRNRFDYVLLRANNPGPYKTFAEAKRINPDTNVTKDWYYGFTEEERAELERLADELHYAHAIQAQLMLEDAAGEAAGVKIAGMKSRDERIRQGAATEVLDRVLGKPTQRTESKTDLTANVRITGYEQALELIYGGDDGQA